jgi:hypothetical protein
MRAVNSTSLRLIEYAGIGLETAVPRLTGHFREDVDLDQAFNLLIGGRIARAAEITSFAEMIGCS